MNETLYKEALILLVRCVNYSVVSPFVGYNEDFSYFIIRFDMGIKLRTPYRDPNIGDKYWRFDQFYKLSLKNGINYNLAIGYPF